MSKKLKPEYVELTAANTKLMSELQEKLYADGREGVVIMLQAMDAAGKDSTIKHVMSGVNPQGVSVYSFKTPSKEELGHDYLWRAVKNLPERGKIAIFNRLPTTGCSTGCSRTFPVPRLQGPWHRALLKSSVGYSSDTHYSLLSCVRSIYARKL